MRVLVLGGVLAAVACVLAEPQTITWSQNADPSGFDVEIDIRKSLFVFLSPTFTHAHTLCWSLNNTKSVHGIAIILTTNDHCIFIL